MDSSRSNSLSALLSLKNRDGFGKLMVAHCPNRLVPRSSTLKMFTTRTQRRHWSCLLLICWSILAGCKPTAKSTTATTKPAKSLPRSDTLKATIERDASDVFFEKESISKIVLQLTPEQERKLNENARQYVRCALVENGGNALVDVGLKLKGAAGSFQELSGKPAFTINVNKFRKQQSFHDLDKFHLNNSVQDELYVNEWLCSSICRDAGIPAPRVTHARVWLNDRDLGLYVVKEGFDPRFLKRHFRDSTGNLYDGGFCQDIGADLEKDAGNGPSDLSDLRALQEACAEPELASRWKRIAEHLDVDAFLRFMAFEMMTGHWDGYVSNCNNYRIYFPPDSKKAWFLPHGMDQTFQDAGFQTFGQTNAMVASSMRENPEWDHLFRQRVSEMLPMFEGDRLASRVQTLQTKIRPALMELNPDGIEGFDQQMEQVRVRLHERYSNIAQQLTEPNPPPPEPEMQHEPVWLELEIGETIALADWEPKQETEASQLNQTEPTEGADEPSAIEYSIAVGDSEDCIASWRKRVQLPEGRYLFLAQLKVSDVAPRENDDRGIGGGLRISGTNRDNSLVSTSDWQEVQYDFQVFEEQQSVQLVAELRATKGSMTMKNFQLKRLEP